MTLDTLHIMQENGPVFAVALAVCGAFYGTFAVFEGMLSRRELQQTLNVQEGEKLISRDRNGTD